MNNLRFSENLRFDKDGPITYLMSAAFRIHYNHGLEYAYNLSSALNKELQIILFKPLEENERNNVFFKNGIQGFERFLSKFTTLVYFFEKVTPLMKEKLQNSSLVIKDMAYLKEDKLIENQIHQLLVESRTSYKLVESNVVVPVIQTSLKEEYSAATIRKKIHSKLYDFIDLLDEPNPSFFKEQEARDLLSVFIQRTLKNYHLRSDPSSNFTSRLSPYLKYGFISPLEIFIELEQSSSMNKDSFIEELVVRRELAHNFVYYNTGYDEFNHITYSWAYQTMLQHIDDEREYLYTIDDYINYKTHDPYFNASMKEMVEHGYMHGYMRMYWCKKIIEWSKSYQEAFETAKYLNNYYFLDGNTPNGYTGIAWCFGKHDRAWKERTVFGKLRYMNAQGLERKFEIQKYVDRLNK